MYECYGIFFNLKKKNCLYLFKWSDWPFNFTFCTHKRNQIIWNLITVDNGISKILWVEWKMSSKCNQLYECFLPTCVWLMRYFIHMLLYFVRNNNCLNAIEWINVCVALPGWMFCINEIAFSTMILPHLKVKVWLLNYTPPLGAQVQSYMAQLWWGLSVLLRKSGFSPFVDMTPTIAALLKPG